MTACLLALLVVTSSLVGCSNAPKDPVTNDWGPQRDLGVAGDVFDLNSPWSGTVVFTSNRDGSSSLMLVKANDDLHMKGDGNENACYWSRTSCTWIIRNVKLAESQDAAPRQIGVLTIVLHPQGDPRVEILMDGKTTPTKIEMLDPKDPCNLVGAKVTATVVPGITA